MANFQAAYFIDQVQTIAGRQTLITTVHGVDAKALRNLHDSVKSKLENAVIVLAGVEGDKVSLLASVASQYSANLKAGDIIKHLATELGG
ncbi:DHHA1 domain-containing protein, partial [Klebsiella pneumoniae]|uniref:DHH family phosphoesterase n=1 Tax=Klebsiella pneumoniae TaxID=573 RepID=UPI002245181E